jgi:hypothetical protein
MAIATIVVLLFLFNRMMNVIFMTDNFDANVISTQGRTIMPQYMKDMMAAMMHIDSHSRQAEKQYSSIINGSDHSSCTELQRTLFMADHPVWMMVCLVPHVHNPTRLVDLSAST